MSRRDDEELVSYLLTGLRMIAAGFESALEGDQRSWPYSDRHLQRRRPKKVVPPAGPPELMRALIERIDRAASEQSLAYETLLTVQEVADFLGLERVSVQQLASSRHIRSTRVGNKVLVQLGELRRYLDEGPDAGMVARTDWRPLVEEFPGRRKQAELEARTEVLRQKYDAVTIKELRTILGVDWDVVDRLERKHVIEPFRVDEPNSWTMVKKSQIPAIKAHLEEEQRRKTQRKAERDAQKREPRINL